MYSIHGKGRALLELRHFYEALLCFDKISEIDPNDITSLFWKAYVYNRQRKFEDEISYYDAILAIKPNDVEALTKKGFALSSLKRYDEAIDVLKNAKKFSDEHTTWNNLAWVLAQNGKNEEALHWIEESLREKPEEIVYLDTKGYILYNMERYNAALSLFNKIIGKDPKDAEYWYHKGLVQLKRKKFADAVRCFDESIEIIPHQPETHNAKAMALSNLNKTDDAIQSFKQALRLDPKFVEAQENLTKAVSVAGGEHRDFWQFWSASPFRMGTAVLLSLFAITLTAYPIMYGYEVIEMHEVNDIITKTINLERKVPDSYLVMIGVIIFILMSPIIKTAKIGPMEFELGRTPSPTSSPTATILISVNSQ